MELQHPTIELLENIHGDGELAIGRMFSRIIFLNLFIVIPTWEAERDCDSSDGYIRDHSDNRAVTVTDICDYECGWMQCGDVCINTKYAKLCQCGEWMLRLYAGNYYCCLDHTPDNRTQCSVDDDGDGRCLQGRVLSKIDNCNNHCFNDYKTSAVIGVRSHYHCGENLCMWALNMCQGYPKCTVGKFRG